MDLVNESPRVLGNRYEVGDLLGRGGMAEVHLGRDTRLGRTVAIKLLRTDLARDPTFQARFRREAQSAAALNHPAIVAVYDTGEEIITESGGATVSLPYIVMEHIEGRTLREILAGGRPLDVNTALEVTIGVLTALEYSHRIGIVHRDIKPANVMLTPTGEVKVMDFGIARALADASSTMTQTQAVIGTAQYLSPEQARGEQVDTRSDLYSTGCLLFELLTGRPPFVADSPVAVAYQHVRELPPAPSTLVPGIPDSVDRIVLHSLAKERDERYQTAAQFRADVEAALGGRQVSAPMPSSANAATQLMGPATGTTMAMGGAAAGGALLGQTGVARPVGYGEDYQGYPDQYGDYRGGQPPQRRNAKGPILLVVAAIAILVLVGFVVSKLIGGGGGAASDVVNVPPVVNQLEDVAKTNISGAGFTPQTKSAPSTADQKGRVIAQDPAGNAKAKKGSVVLLTIGAGPSTVTIPDDLVGQQGTDAATELKNRGLNPVIRTEQPKDTSIQPGQVIRTNPDAGTQVAPGSTVRIYVASKQIFVENLVNENVDVAKSRLNELGFQVNTQTVANSAPAGTVIDQSPKSTYADRGSTVTLTVSDGTGATSSPTPTGTPWPTSTTPTPTGTASASATL